MARSEIFDGVSFTTGVVRNRTFQYLLATKDELVTEDIPHARLYSFKGGNVGGMPVEWAASSAGVCTLPEERFLTLGVSGVVQVIGGGQKTEENVGAGSEGPEQRGPMREVRGIAKGRAYAVGARRQVYRRDAPAQWTCIDRSASSQTKGIDLSDTCFESIDGFSENDIFVVGWEGEIWHWDGNLWAPEASPTKLALYKVRCGTDGCVYACGQNGMLLRRATSGTWEVLASFTKEDLWGLEWFAGKLYVSSTHLVYTLEGTQPERVKFGDDVPSTTSHLSAADGILWSIGPKDVVQFDGLAWTRIV